MLTNLIYSYLARASYLSILPYFLYISYVKHYGRSGYSAI